MTCAMSSASEREANSKHWFTTSCLQRGRCRKAMLGVWDGGPPKLQALVYDILRSTSAVFSYAIGSIKLSANKQFFVGAQTVVGLLQTTQIISDVCFITDHIAYASSNQTKVVWIVTELFLNPGMDASHIVDASHIYVGACALGCFHSLISTQTFRRALTATVDSCVEIKSAPSVV